MMASDEKLSEKQKMLRGELYRATDPQLTTESFSADRLLRLYDAIPANERQRRFELLKELLGHVGDGAMIRPPFYCDYGYNIFLGRDAFLNFNCVLLDVAEIRIGDGTKIGPAVQIYAADHPREKDLRLQDLECAKPVNIGANVWIGGGAIILPGVTIGDHAIVGAGAVVTRDVEPGQTVVGNPIRVIREQGH